MPRFGHTWLQRLGESIFARPLAFIAAGFLGAVVLLGVDAVLGPEAVPGWLRFDAAAARSLFATLAGALLTLAGITFWVRAAAVQMAAGQFTPRVVQAFLHDWFQQSMMGLLLGMFTYVVVVFRALPQPGGAVPQLAVLAGAVSAAAAVLALLAAIRNGVHSMQAGELARRITDRTMASIRQRPCGQCHDQAAPVRSLPTGPGHVVRARASGWVQEIRETRLLETLPAQATVRLEVRPGLFVIEGRPLCTIWSPEGVWLDLEPGVRAAIRLGRSRSERHDLHHGLQQLADLARGSLIHGIPDTGAAYEAIVHLGLILRELLQRDLPPTAYADRHGRQLVRARDFSLEDYVGVAFDQLRVAAAPHPAVVLVLLETLGALIQELNAAGRPHRAAPLRQQAELTWLACEHAGLLEHDLRRIRVAAARLGLALERDGSSA